MGIAYKASTASPTSEIAARLKEAILASSDWAHLQLASGTQATTMSATAAASATSISTAATIPSGSYVVLWRANTVNGAVTPEVRRTTGVSGGGPYTVTLAEALTAPLGTYQIGDAIGVGSYSKATTTRGAQMVIDLADSAPSTGSNAGLQLGVYRAHDGTTAGTKATRYLGYKAGTGGSAATTLYYRVSASKEHIYFDVEGPRPGDTNVSSTYGDVRSCFALCDLTPYAAGDTIPAVVMVSAASAGSQVRSAQVWVSRNRAGTTEWQTGQLRTLALPNDGTLALGQSMPSPDPDGSWDLAPYVFVDDYDGLRGRLTYIHFGGIYLATSPSYPTDPSPLPEGVVIPYSGINYIALHAFKASDNNYGSSYGFAAINNRFNSAQCAASPVVLVPKS